jgi:hypothetical protein
MRLTRREFKPAVRHAALVRAGFRCEKCGSRERLELHHIGNRQDRSGFNAMVLCVLRIQGNKNRSSFPVKTTGDGDRSRGPEYAEIVVRNAQDIGMTDVTVREVKKRLKEHQQNKAPSATDRDHQPSTIDHR